MTNSQKHIMITGGMGFIGHTLTRLYLDAGFTVTVVDTVNTLGYNLLALKVATAVTTIVSIL